MVSSCMHKNSCAFCDDDVTHTGINDRPADAVCNQTGVAENREISKEVRRSFAPARG